MQHASSVREFPRIYRGLSTFRDFLSGAMRCIAVADGNCCAERDDSNGIGRRPGEQSRASARSGMIFLDRSRAAGL